MDLAFKHFAMRDGLEELRLSGSSFRDFGTSLNVIQDVAMSARAARRAASCNDDSDQTGPPQKRQRRCLPFQQLRTLDMSLDSYASVAHLAMVLCSVRRLTLAIRGPRLGRCAAAVFLPFYLVRPFRALHLSLGRACIFRGDMRPLQALTGLRELGLRDATAGDTTDADVAELLRALPCLRSLTFVVRTLRTSAQLLRVIAETRPQLRRLTLLTGWSPGPSMDAAREAPLFPCLEYMQLVGFAEHDLPDLRSVRLRALYS
jgi:hypothetical protein